ncbi:DNA-directed RNA polymerase subunit H [archaeon]|nr:MAG: DNA-directed RNA polymerase subunit H [archaeon]
MDIFKHQLVPKHEILDDAQKAELLKKYGIILRQLPRMLDTDPVIKQLNGKAGDVVKITRESATAGQAEYYRLVIKG